MIRVEAEPFDAAAELAAFTGSAAGAGAIASFVGLVRSDSGGRHVSGLELQHYPGVTEKSVAAIADDARARFGIAALAIIHRQGSLAPGEAIVFVAVAAAHRRPAFDAVDYVMDRLKTEAAFWKREHGPEGPRWVEARAADLEARARWG